MGIKGLRTKLQAYGVIGSLRGQSCVIDGPALVHHIWSKSAKAHKSYNVAILGEVSYMTLSRSLIQWLDWLRAHEVIVRKIYFDGYLPPRKWRTRRERLLTSSQDTKLACASVGSPVQRHRGDESQLRGRGVGRMPKHPFLVPAVLEQLRLSPDWRSVVQLVPGEADAYCAQDVRQNGGLVLTNDSDLLVEDLGPSGAVVFLGDVTEIPGEMAVVQYAPAAMEICLGVQDSGGMLRLAYEMSKHAQTSTKAARVQAQATMVDSGQDRDDYQAFLANHVPEEYVPPDHPVVAVLATLDPRISELIVQSLNLEVFRPHSKESKVRGPRESEELSMFLPIMVEDREKKSSWFMSEHVRQLAYAMSQHPELRKFNNIVEYRTLDSERGGRQLGILDAETVSSSCEELLAAFKAIDSAIRDPELRWIAFAIYQEIIWCTAEDKTPRAPVLVGEAIRHPDDFKASEVSWELLHFAAQVQASLYSLRMLHQTLHVMAELFPVTLSKSRQELWQYLAALPTIAEYPTVDTLGPLLRRIHEVDGLATISTLLGLPDCTPGRSEMKSFGKRTRKDEGSTEPRKTPRSAANNPFAVLSQDW